MIQFCSTIQEYTDLEQSTPISAIYTSKFGHVDIYIKETFLLMVTPDDGRIVSTMDIAGINWEM